MKRPVRWEREALDDFKAQIGYIAADNPHAAQRVAHRIQAAVASLGDIITGRPGGVAGTYEKVVTHLPYIIAFEISSSRQGEAVTILRVIHTARDWPANEWPGSS